MRIIGPYRPLEDTQIGVTFMPFSWGLYADRFFFGLDLKIGPFFVRVTLPTRIFDQTGDE